MKKLSNTEAELKKGAAYKKSVYLISARLHLFGFSRLAFFSIVKCRLKLQLVTSIISSFVKIHDFVHVGFHNNLIVANF